MSERDPGGDGGRGLRLTWTRREAWRDGASLSEGCYLLRTNLTDWKPEEFWKAYIQLTQAEAAFRTQKSELRLRPIWRQLSGRVPGHVLFSFLAHALWKTLEPWMARSGLGNGPRPVIDALTRIKVTDVALPTSANRGVRLRCVTTPDAPQRALLQRLGLALPQRLGEPRWAENLASTW